MVNAYIISCAGPLQTLFGFSLVGSGVYTEEIGEGASEFESEELFGEYILRYASVGDIVFVVHDGMYNKFVCKV